MHNKILAAGAFFSVLLLSSTGYAESEAGLKTEQIGQFKTYVVQQARPSYTYNSDLVVGAELPAQGVTYYELPPEYGVTQYRYTVVNSRPVLVDPTTRRVIQVVE